MVSREGGRGGLVCCAAGSGSGPGSGPGQFDQATSARREKLASNANRGAALLVPRLVAKCRAFGVPTSQPSSNRCACETPSASQRLWTSRAEPREGALQPARETAWASRVKSRSCRLSCEEGAERKRGVIDVEPIVETPYLSYQRKPAATSGRRNYPECQTKGKPRLPPRRRPPERGGGWDRGGLRGSGALLTSIHRLQRACESHSTHPR